MAHKTRATGPLLVLRSRSAFFSGLVPLLVLRPRPPFLLWSSPVSGCTVQIRCWLHGHARLFCSGLVPFLVVRSRSALLSESSLFLGYTDPQIHKVFLRILPHVLYKFLCISSFCILLGRCLVNTLPQIVFGGSNVILSVILRAINICEHLAHYQRYKSLAA